MSSPETPCLTCETRAESCGAREPRLTVFIAAEVPFRRLVVLSLIARVGTVDGEPSILRPVVNSFMKLLNPLRRRREAAAVILVGDGYDLPRCSRYAHPRRGSVNRYHL